MQISNAICKKCKKRLLLLKSSETPIFDVDEEAGVSIKAYELIKTFYCPRCDVLKKVKSETT